MKFGVHLKTTTFWLFFVSLLVLAVTNYFAIEYSLYWVFLWLDIPMHFLGGIVVALGFLSFTKIHEHQSARKAPLYTLLFVFFVGVIWEILELQAGTSVLGAQSELVPDTLLDIVMDLLGGIVGFFVAKSVSTLDV